MDQEKDTVGIIDIATAMAENDIGIAAEYFAMVISCHAQ